MAASWNITAAPSKPSFVLLHPFIKPVTIDAEQFTPATYPDRPTLIKNCGPVSWAEIAAKAKLPSIAAVDIGLRTMIRGLNTDLSNEEYAGRLKELAESERIIDPPEGMFSDLLHDNVLQAIQYLGYEWVWIGDEFCTERKLYWIDDLKGSDASATRGHCNVFTPDKALLWTTHWDSHFSFLCSSRRNLEVIEKKYRLEGFFCAQDTQVYWSVHL